ncbi:hypothetical protein NDU88_003041 [Pleurodeles waltl]|uniref:Uncharacterized protein n=1 Tax=Pleurodeles waltl TaxID=8319 RepID=A0AAV7NFJ3_PLEWA|nr:hypothetical protein NDU88_003041 [Pleurodeles waltl]
MDSLKALAIIRLKWEADIGPLALHITAPTLSYLPQLNRDLAPHSLLPLLRHTLDDGLLKGHVTTTLSEVIGRSKQTEPVTPPDPTMEAILQEITAVGATLGIMDSKIWDLSTEVKTINSEIGLFHGRMESLVKRVSFLESKPEHYNSWDADIWHLRNKVVDLEDRANRNNIFFKVSLRT